MKRRGKLKREKQKKLYIEHTLKKKQEDAIAGLLQQNVQVTLSPNPELSTATKVTVGLALLSGIVKLATAHPIADFNTQVTTYANPGLQPQNPSVFQHLSSESLNNNNLQAPSSVQVRTLGNDLITVVKNTIALLNNNNQNTLNNLYKSINDIEKNQKKINKKLSPLHYVDTVDRFNQLTKSARNLTPEQKRIARENLEFLKINFTDLSYLTKNLKLGRDDDLTSSQKVLIYRTSLEDIINVVRESLHYDSKITTPLASPQSSIMFKVVTNGLNPPKASSSPTSETTNEGKITHQSIEPIRLTKISTTPSSEDKTTLATPQTSGNSITIGFAAAAALSILSAAAGVGISFFRKWRTGSYHPIALEEKRNQQVDLESGKYNSNSFEETTFNNESIPRSLTP